MSKYLFRKLIMFEKTIPNNIILRYNMHSIYVKLLEKLECLPISN